MHVVLQILYLHDSYETILLAVGYLQYAIC